jgi:hypothetical protein
MGLACGMPVSAAKGYTVSKLTEAPKSSLLSDQSLSVVQATAPVVVAHADEITARSIPACSPPIPSCCESSTRETRPPNHRTAVPCQPLRPDSTSQFSSTFPAVTGPLRPRPIRQPDDQLLTGMRARPGTPQPRSAGQRPVALAAATSASPAGCIRPAASKASTLAALIFDHGLPGRRGE